MLLTTDRSLSKFIYVLFSFHSKIYIWRDVWMRCMTVRMRCVMFGESLAFSPRWGSLSLSLLTFCTVYLCTKWGSKGGWVPLGNSSAIIKQHKALVFRDLSEFHPNHSFVFLSFDCILALNSLIIHAPPIQVSQDGRLRRFKQWPKGLLGRRRLASTIVNSSLCITCTRLCHFNKIDLLTYLLVCF